LGALEIGGSLVAALLALAGIVDEEFRHLAECPALFAVIDDEAGASRLRLAHAFLDAVNKVGPASADVGTEYVGAVALVMNPARERARSIGNRVRVAENVERDPADRRQKYREIRPGGELRIHAARLLEERAPQLVLGDA